MSGVFILVAAAGILLLSACGRSKNTVLPVASSPPPAVSGGTPIATPDLASPDLPGHRLTVDTEYEKAFSKIDPMINQAISVIDAARRDDLSSVTFGFEKKLVYDILTAKDKALYDEVLSKVRNFEAFIYPADEYGYDVLDRVMIVCGAIARDWPELENYFVIHEVNEDDKTVALESLYFMPWDAEQQAADTKALRAAAALFDAVCERIVERMPEGLSTWDQYRYFATVISFATDYDHDCTGGWQDGTAYGSVVGGYSICQGYSRGFMTLCQKANLWCVCVDGVVDGTAHMWNMVKLDTGVFHVDITWSDELGVPGSAEWLKYFMRTEEEISVDHTIVGETIGETIKDYEKEYRS